MEKKVKNPNYAVRTIHQIDNRQNRLNIFVDQPKQKNIYSIML